MSRTTTAHNCHYESSRRFPSPSQADDARERSTSPRILDVDLRTPRITGSVWGSLFEMSRPSLSYAIWLSAKMWSPNLASSSPDMKCDLPSLAGQIGTGAQRGSVRCLRQPGISTRADADADAHTRTRTRTRTRGSSIATATASVAGVASDAIPEAQMNEVVYLP
ncbi:hypothetical protein PMIN01_04374 [Paraphaeosphaeria minitans]|uniref:Uncharacterized protein n=1 Tax=Paraphaeosphaeria minitans TaxID=565426 RepID=A0A9P6GLK8_9PLEO|nr:hypothetical protein PMIN01_04374 [Paraphaeosphaeria minitans]